MSHVQPLDAGIIANFKCWCHSEFINFAINQYENHIPIGNIFKINSLEAMKFANKSWFTVSESTIANCCRHSGILTTWNPDGSVKRNNDQSGLIEQSALHLIEDKEATDALESGLYNLKGLDIIHRPNRMSIPELLNLVGKQFKRFERVATQENL